MANKHFREKSAEEAWNRVNEIFPTDYAKDEQTYTYEPDENGTEYTFRWSRKYQRYGQPGNLSLSKGRHEFYDYNF